METRDRDTLAGLLRDAASQSISEAKFWREAQDLTDRLDEPILKLAAASARGYWELFHQKKRFFRIMAQPDRAELRQATDELNLIAAVLETGWQLPVISDVDTGN